LRILSGIQSSGILHIGNYFGMMKKMIELQEGGDLYVFIANYHALTSLKNPKILKQDTIDAAVTFLSLGLDPEKSTFWLQSDVKEVLELYWILSSFTPMGLLERAHSYKDKTAKGIPANHSLFSYPVLMAADILLYDSEIVPVGKDQIQHIEMTRDIAIKFNNQFGEVFTVPKFKVDENVQKVVGVDGEKMSKSYGNTIDIFSTKKNTFKQVGKIKTDSTPLEEPKEFEGCNVYEISKLFMNEEELSNLRERYKKGGEGYGHFKVTLREKIWDYFEPHRKKREYYLKNLDEVRDILKFGADKARIKAKTKMEIIKDKVGII